MSNSIDIKKYLNIFQFLQDVYKLRKEIEQDFSYEKWSTEMEIFDKSYLRMIVIGKRHLNEKTSLRLVENLKLNEEDKKYFFNLVHYTQSKTHEEKKVFGQKLIELIKDELQQSEINAHYQFLTDPILPRLLVLLSLNDVSQDIQNLSWILGAETEVVTNCLVQLKKMGFVEFKNGKYESLKKSFKLPDQFNNLGLEMFYLKNLTDAGEAIKLSPKNRRYRSLFLPMNEKEFELYLENLNEFAKKQLAQFNPDKMQDRRLYQVHFNIIPVSELQRTELEP